MCGSVGVDEGDVVFGVFMVVIVMVCGCELVGFGVVVGCCWCVLWFVLIFVLYVLLMVVVFVMLQEVLFWCFYIDLL